MKLDHDPASCVRCLAIGSAIIVKKCACGRRYTAGTWKDLALVGVQDDGVERIELRNCACGSTIGVILGPSERLAELDS